MRVLVTGGGGFIGSALINRLLRDPECHVRAVVRRRTPVSSGNLELVQVGELGAKVDWMPIVSGMEAVVHTAARVHVMRDNANDPLSEFRRVNVVGTINLAKQAAGAGVRRFIFVSSIKVNGEKTGPGRAFTEKDQPAPQDAYAVSKWEAEQGLSELAEKTGMEVVIVRPPLVYGPGVKANFFVMMQWLNRGIPLPLGAIRNRRSLVSLDNVVDMIITCMTHPAAANQTFLAADGEDMSTPELLKRVGEALGKPPWLLPVPIWLLEAGAMLLGKRAAVQRLCGSLRIDISKAQALLNWTPPQSVDQAIRLTTRHFLG